MIIDWRILALLLIVDQTPFSFDNFYFVFSSSFFTWGGMGLLYEAGSTVVYIHVFVPQKNHLDFVHFTFKTCIF